MNTESVVDKHKNIIIIPKKFPNMEFIVDKMQFVGDEFRVYIR